MEVLAVIPARGGSKGLPKKNVLPLAGHPLIAYSILAAQQSNLITRTLVSTDADYIREVALAYGAVTFRRPAELAGDLTTDLEVFKHLLLWLQTHEGYKPDLVVQVRPTSPIRPVGLIDQCIGRLLNSKADSLRVVTKSPITPYKMWTLTSETEPMQPLLKLENVDEPFNQPRQALPDTYWQIGCLDVIRTAVIVDQHSMSGKNILPHVLPYTLAIDIDDLSSFERAERVIKTEPCVQFS